MRALGVDLDALGIERAFGVIDRRRFAALNAGRRFGRTGNAGAPAPRSRCPGFLPSTSRETPRLLAPAKRMDVDGEFLDRLRIEPSAQAGITPPRPPLIVPAMVALSPP